jgi:hypothetical protein
MPKLGTYFHHPVILFVVTVFFVFLNEKLTFIQVIVCVNTISLLLTILVGGTVLNLLLNALFECLFKFLSVPCGPC